MGRCGSRHQPRLRACDRHPTWIKRMRQPSEDAAAARSRVNKSQRVIAVEDCVDHQTSRLSPLICDEYQRPIGYQGRDVEYAAHGMLRADAGPEQLVPELPQKGRVPNPIKESDPARAWLSDWSTDEKSCRDVLDHDVLASRSRERGVITSR